MKTIGESSKRSQAFLSNEFWDTKVKPFIDTNENGCWLWTQGKDYYKYGRVCFGKEVLRVHVVSYIYHSGMIVPDGICVLHKCDVRHCLNPDHLFLGTKSDNARDKTEKGRARGPQSLNHADLIEIRRLIDTGLTHKEIAAKMNTSAATVSRVRNDKCNYYRR